MKTEAETPVAKLQDEGRQGLLTNTACQEHTLPQSLAEGTNPADTQILDSWPPDCEKGNSLSVVLNHARCANLPWQLQEADISWKPQKTTPWKYTGHHKY